MEPREIVEYLKEIPLFDQLTDSRGDLELYHVAEITEEHTYPEGAWIFSQGEVSDRLFLILDGKLRLSRIDREGVTHQGGEIGAGDVLGVTGLLVGDFHDVSAEAITDLHVLAIPRDAFEEVYDERGYLRRHLNVSPEVAKRQHLPDFEWLREDEWVIFAEQRHWSQLVRLIMAPVLLFALLLPVAYALLSAEGLLRLLSVVIAIPLIGLVGLIAWQYLNWRDDMFILTTQRVVHIERVWPFKQNFEETSLENIEDVYQAQPSLSANILNYGNLVLQTAGDTVQVDMTRVPNPDHLREVIFREMERSQARNVLQQRTAIQAALQSRLGVETLPPPVKVELPEREEKRPFFLTIIFGGIMEYFFPPSWSFSEDNSTVFWRRFWLPGLVRYFGLFLVLGTSTFAGIYFLLQFWTQPGVVTWFIVWLFVEAVLFSLVLWFVEDWRNDYFQLTPNRIVEVNRKPLLLQESRHEAPLDRIQNISFEVPGVIASIFSYGHVMLETAGALGRFELKWVRHPQKVQAEISNRQQQYSQHMKEVEAKRRQDELLSWFATYDRVRKQAGGNRMTSPDASTEARPPEL